MCSGINDTFSSAPTEPPGRGGEPFVSTSALGPLPHTWSQSYNHKTTTSIAQLLKEPKQDIILLLVVQEPQSYFQTSDTTSDQGTACQGLRSWPKAFKRMVQSILSSGCTLPAPALHVVHRRVLVLTYKDISPLKNPESSLT